MRSYLFGAALALTALVATEAARAQQMPQMPSKQEIERRVVEELEKLPSLRAESTYLVIECKQLPTDPMSVAMQLAKGQVPAGIDPEVVAKQALPMVRPIIDKYAADLGTFTPLTDLKIKSKTLKKDRTYKFGLIMDGLKPVGVLISGEGLKKPLRLPLKPKRTTTTYDPMTIEVVASKKNAKKLYIHVGFADRLGAAGYFKVK